MSQLKLFGTDGIRALAGQYPLTEETIEKIGFAAGTVLKNKSTHKNPSIIIGKDTRASGGWIEKSLSKGLILSGVKVSSCGVIPTPAISALLKQGTYIGGSVISASHNPVEYNGIKFFSSQGTKLTEEEENEIERELGKSASQLIKNSGSIHSLETEADAEARYMEFIKNSMPPSFSLKGLKWVLDCANGSSFNVAPKLFKELGADIHVIHHQPDGNNINLKCGALYPDLLRKKVLELKADGGCAFDGDADRVQFVDEKGQLMDGDVLIGLAAEYLKNKNELKKDTVVTTVMANLGFHKEMKKLDIQVITTPVGDRSVSQALETSGTVLGGEQSGHIIFYSNLPTGDGLLTALKILDAVTSMKKKLSNFTENFQKFPQVLINLKVKKKIPIENLPQVKKEIRDAEAKLNEIGRVLVRYSGTENLLRIMLEGESEPVIQQLAQAIKKAAQKELT